VNIVNLIVMKDEKASLFWEYANFLVSYYSSD